MKPAFITGINGQDGSYVAELLLSKGYRVVGLVRRLSVPESQTSRLEEAGVFTNENLHLEYVDMTDNTSLYRILNEYKPDEIYNLAAQSHVRISFDQPLYTAQTVAIGVMNLLESVRLVCPDARVYQASSSEMFGNSIDDDGFQRETTPMYPASPYGCAKVYAYNIGRNYRNAYDMFISNGILFNHESPRRGTNFVTNKIVKEAVKIKNGLSDKLLLGNINATRDWGHAKDYVRAMFMILEQEVPGDYICATGISHSVKELCEYTFSKIGLDYNDYIGIDEKYFRPEELVHLKGDALKLKSIGFKAEYTFETMLDEMINWWEDYYKRFN